MKLAVCIVLILLVFTAESDGCSSNTRVNAGIRNGVDVNRGRHNLNLNYANTRYNYQGNRANVYGKHNHWNKETAIGVNKGNHNLEAKYNHHNKKHEATYKLEFGKRRRRELGTSQRDIQTAEVRLKELSKDLEILKTLVPIIGQVSLPPEEQPITDKILARDMVCLVRQFSQLLPQMKLFIKKMVRKHGPEYGLQVELEDENIPECPVFGESAVVQGAYRLERQQLVELKNFVSELILTELRLRAEIDE